MGMAVGGVGSLCFLIGWIWIIVLAFQNGDTVWRICSILFCGLVALIYGIMHFQQAKVPVILLVIGMIAGGAGQVMMPGLGVQ